MKKLLLSIFTLINGFISSAQFVTRMEVKEPIPGVCDARNQVCINSLAEVQVLRVIMFLLIRVNS